MEHTDKEVDFALTLLQMSRAFGYRGAIVPPNDRKVTGKWFNSKRREILAFARGACPEMYAAYLVERKMPVAQRLAQFEHTQKLQTTDSENLSTQEPEAPPL